MAICLEKGENRKLDLHVFHVGLGWDVREDATSNEDFDLDVSAFLIGRNGKVLSDDYLVFYNSEKRVRPSNLNKIVSSSDWSSNNDMRHESRPVDPELPVIGSIDDEDGATSEDGDDETMDINLTKVSMDVQEIVICVSIHKWKERKQNFGQVHNSYIRIYEAISNTDIARYDLDEDFSIETAVEFGRLYKRGSEWKFEAMGIGYKGGLQFFVDKYVK